MSMAAAVRYVASSTSKASLGGTIYLQCIIKPGAAKSREGITGVTDQCVEVCVAARPHDGEANKAVISVLSKALDLSKSQLQITRGTKSREKTVAIGGLRSGSDEDLIDYVRRILESNVNT